MKLRYLCLVFTVIACLTLSGCSRKTQQFTLREFESEVLVSDGEKQIRGNFCLANGADMTFEITSPRELQGITVSLTGGEKTLTYCEMELEYDELVLKNDVLSDLFRCVSLLSSGSYEVSSHDEKGVITLSEGENEYKVYLTAGQPEKISSDKKGISYSFFYS